MPRFHCPIALSTGQCTALPAGAARHVQVLRLQPGAVITLFNGQGGEFRALIEQIGRSEVRVRIESHDPVEREARRPIHLAAGMPANERMDWLVEKATELGAASLQPVMAERTIVRLHGERAQRKQAHWQAIATAACEQCGRNRVPPVRLPMDLSAWLQTLERSSAAERGERWLLSLAPDAQSPASCSAPDTPITLLSGPEGGLSAAEEAAARDAGFRPVTLGARVLRAETAPLAALVRWADPSSFEGAP